MAGSTTVGGIKVKIGADTTGFDTGLQKTRKGLNSIGKWGTAAAAAVAVGAAAIVRSQLDVLDSLAKTSDALGIQQEKLQALQHIGELTGTSNEMVNRSLERMQRNLGAAARLGGASADALEDLGVSVKDIIKLKPEEQMEVLAKALSGVENQVVKASIANDIFGRNGTRMLKMLDQLKKEGLDPTVKSLNDMGVSLTRIDTSKVEQANDAMFKAGQVATGLANKLTVKLSPILESISNQFIDGAKDSEGFSSVVDDSFNGAISIIGVFADGLHGIGVIFQGIKVIGIGFAAAVGSAIEGVSIIVATAVDGWILMINEGIKALNVIGADLDVLPLLSDSKFMKNLQADGDEMRNILSASIDQLHEKMMEPLPSEALTQWVANAEAASAAVAETLVGSMIPTDDEIELVIEKQAIITEEERKAAEARIKLAQAEAAAKKAAMSTMFNDLASLMNSGSKKAFKVGKIAAIASAGIKGVGAAVSAWDAGMSVGGPFAPITAAAYAGASLLKTGSMINQIKSQSFGGASSPTSFSGGLPTVNTSGGGGQSQQNQTNVSIDIVGSEGATFSRSQIESLIGGINDATGDGVKLNTGG
jgi:hypothetical protein